MKFYLLSILLAIIDQISKIWIKNNFILGETYVIIDPFLKFTFVKNPGMAFGISVGDMGIFITILSFFATLFICYYLWIEKNNHPLISYGLSMILGGAIGNLIDRSTIFFTEYYEGVIDFINIGIGSKRWYIFNLADSFVTIGIILFLLHSYIIYRTKVVDAFE